MFVVDAVVGVVYSAVLSTSHLLTPLVGGGATAAAIVLATVVVRLLLLPLTVRQIAVERRRARLVPRIEKLRKKHRHDPLKAAAEVTALYRANGVGTATTLLPLLGQAPFFVVLYSLFRRSSVGGHPNALLSHELLGVPLGAHWHDGALFGVHGVVFVGVLALLATVATVSARRLRRLGQPRLLALSSFVTVVVAATVPLASALYLLTTTIWTTVENALLRDRPAAFPTRE